MWATWLTPGSSSIVAGGGGRGKVCGKCWRRGRRCTGSRYVEYVVRAVFIRRWVLIHTVLGGGGDGGCDDDRDEATIDLRSGSQILLYKLKRGQCGVLELSSTILIGAFNAVDFHSL